MGHGLIDKEAQGVLDAPLSRGMTVCDSIIRRRVLKPNALALPGSAV
jgi:hypothetical protein